MRFLLIVFFIPAQLWAFEETIRPILENSCLKCHGGEKVKGVCNDESFGSGCVTMEDVAVDVG